MFLSGHSILNCQRKRLFSPPSSLPYFSQFPKFILIPWRRQYAQGTQIQGQKLKKVLLFFLCRKELFLACADYLNWAVTTAPGMFKPQNCIIYSHGTLFFLLFLSTYTLNILPLLLQTNYLKMGSNHNYMRQSCGSSLWT